MLKSGGSGPSDLNQRLRYRTNIGIYHSLNGTPTALFSGSDNGRLTIYFAQSLDADEDVLQDAVYGLTVRYSAIAGP